MFELTNGPTRVVVDPADGGQIRSVAVDDLELLTDDGAFVMAPWAGRTRRGHFTFDGVEHQLAINHGPHAIHGTVRDLEWSVEELRLDAARLRCDFGPQWPFAGWAEHSIVVREDRVDLELAMHTTEPRMPAVGGWHPWWRRSLDRGGVAALELPATSMYVRDDDGIATEALVAPPRGPWDDCFTGLTGPPILRWPGAIELVIASDCPCVVVYDEPPDSICVEPQSGPPDALNHDPAVAKPGEPVVVHSSWAWGRPRT